MFPMLTLLVTGMAIAVVAVVAALTEEGEKNAAAWRARMEREQAEREKDVKVKITLTPAKAAEIKTLDPFSAYFNFEGTWEEWEAQLNDYLAAQRKRLEGK